MKISVNDQFGLTQLCAERIQLILSAFDTQPKGEWKIGADMETLTMARYAKTLEREYESSLNPEELKMLLKGAEYALIPKNLHGRMRHDLVLDDSPYLKLCDLDVWVPTKRLAAWDKISSKIIQKLTGIEDERLAPYAIQKLDERLSQKFDENMHNALRSHETRIIEQRAECDTLDIGYKR